MLGIAVFLIGLVISIRILYLYFGDHGGGHIQSLTLSAVLMLIGLQLVVVGMAGGLIAVNRKLLAKVRWWMQDIDSEGIASETDNEHA